MRLFGGWRYAGVTGAAWRGRGLCADDRRGTVDLAKMRERDLKPCQWECQTTRGHFF